eukprot:CAMPEP_0172493460 /NCGR_PEP_ID=MMETSP1066-20121228/24924_1 /TAXON_ID=671091 /ORGANISM="Coscinodiscus wailesii, Strain CCMP2513" /LENGTH=239 /DNA_ID=CAMNT_0013263655 /DNA_START=431 /DNA_END=1150 /DNA_ORIENTATION=-
MFNTGTNILHKILSKNCYMPGQHKRTGTGMKIRWIVPWGKHTPASWRGKHVSASPWAKGIPPYDVLPIVMIKDPYTWMSSMCRHHYTAIWLREEGHCPNLVSMWAEGVRFPVKVQYNSTHATFHESLVGLWNDWNEAYVNVDYPRLMVRFEDLLFYPEEVTKLICECAGGMMTKVFEVELDNAKAGMKGHTGTSDFYDAVMRYSNESLRVDGYTKNDLEFARQTINTDLMKAFRYTFPD